MQWGLFILIIAIGVMSVWWNMRFQRRLFKEAQKPELMVIPPPQVNVDLNPLRKELAGLPNKVLQSIQSSTNVHKGALGELIGYIQIRSSYDRVIPLGNIVDFVGIRFSREGVPGTIDFIDVKTGKSARLSKEQRNLQKLIDDKRIGFIKLKVDSVTSKDG